MPGPQQLAVFSTKPLGADNNFSVGWIQYFQSVEQRLVASPKAYSLTRAQRLALVTANVTLGSMAWETDVSHLQFWNGTAWVQLA